MGFLQTCKKNKNEYIYVNLVDFFPYLTNAVEENFFDFTKKYKNRYGSDYLLKGFKFFRRKVPKIWAVEKKSTITLFYSELEDKSVVLECFPFNPPGQPFQVGEIYINNIYLQTIKFEKEGKYFFKIPSTLLNYGSNFITFKWKYLRSPKKFGINNDPRRYAAGFSYLTYQYQNKSKTAKRVKKLGKIGVDRKNKIPRIHIPQGGTVEYFLHLPEKSFLKFRLSSRRKGNCGKNSIFHLAIYNEKKEKTIYHFKNDQFNSRKEHKINLSQYAKTTVKIVFANCIRNHPNFTVSLINPTIYSTAQKDLPPFPGKEKTKIAKKIDKKQKDTNKKPNIFIYLIDTLRADHLSCYGYFRETTPYIDKFSKSSVLFKNCFANASWTKPAVGSILTGLYPNKHRAEDRKDKLSTEVNMISEILKTRGYTTIYLTPNVNVSDDINFNQGNDFYKFFVSGEHRRNLYRSSEYLNSDFFEFIKNNPHLLDKPIFAYLHTVDPHDPYTPEAPFLTFKIYDTDREKLAFPDHIHSKKQKNGLNGKDIEFIKALYYCEILNNDYYFGKFIDFLKEKNLYENSIIILIADHGEQFNEHDGLFHGQSIYNEEIHIPLIIKFPHGEFSGTQIETIVSQVDILPTILDYLGIKISPEVDGISILDILKLKNNHLKRSVFIKETLGNTHFVGIVNVNRNNRNKHIITYKDESFILALNVELYNLVEDFDETDDIFEKANIFQIKSIKFFADYFLQRMEASAFKKEKKLDYKKLDPEKINQLKALGYLN
jgi:arylsulfatase A-like enzyme